MTRFVVWWVGVLGLHPTLPSSSEVTYLPSTMFTRKLEDERGLTSILQRYQELLETYATALDAAPFNPHESLPRAFLRSIRALSPSSVRRGRERVRQMNRTPNVLATDLIGAEAVLVELGMLTAAQLSAIEECHRVNVRRLRQGSMVRLVPGLIGVLSGLVVIVKGVSGVKFSNLLPLIGGITLTGYDIQSILTRAVIGVLGTIVLMLITDGIRYVPILQRLQAFEDILAIAKTYRKGPSEATKPPGEQSAMITG
jgi:hypothetical protein